MPSRPGSSRTYRRTRRANRTATRRRGATTTRRTVGAGCGRARTRGGARSRACAATTSPAWSSDPPRSSGWGAAGSWTVALLGRGRLVPFGEMEEDTGEVAASVGGGDRFRIAVGDDLAVREKHDAFAH